MRVPTIQKASKALLLTGSPPRLNRYDHRSHETSRSTGVSTTRGLDTSCVQPVWTGQTRSEFSSNSSRFSVLTSRFSIKQQLKNKELAVPGNHWPLFLYRNEAYNPEEPWRGFCRSKLLVCVRSFMRSYWHSLSTDSNPSLQGYKHIFTSPSSVDEDPRATRSGNARLHGMTSITAASIAYVATQVSNIQVGSVIF